MARLSPTNIRLINELRRRFPQKIALRAMRSADGGFVAEFVDFQGLWTEGETLSELVDMVNDAIRTYFAVPAKYLPYMPTYLPPVKMAQDLDAFPIRKRDAEFQVTRISNEETLRTR